MTSTDEDRACLLGLFFGVLGTIAVGFALWQGSESACQKDNNVYDCEWARTPFMPVEKEPKP
jgi:hypothetical protein